jgi:rSAM/selenodomain-associated transferase 1
VLDVQLVVLAKAPVPGRVKTRLCPPLTPSQAADVAAAALGDTLSVVSHVAVRRRLVVLDGDADGLIPAGFDVLPQRGDGLDERLAAAYDDAFSTAPWPVLLVGMDTPQLDVGELTRASLLLAGGAPVLGLADDGGWWALGLRKPDPLVFLGVPMSVDTTGAEQERRMLERGLRPRHLSRLRDIDRVEDLWAAAAAMPASSRLAILARRLETSVPVLTSGA